VRVGVIERDTEIVVLPGCAAFLLRLYDIVFGRATVVVPVGEQKDELSLVRRLKMRAINEHGEMVNAVWERAQYEETSEQRLRVSHIRSPDQPLSESLSGPR
jgi:hypothetical protein